MARPPLCPYDSYFFAGGIVKDCGGGLGMLKRCGGTWEVVELPGGQSVNGVNMSEEQAIKLLIEELDKKGVHNSSSIKGAG